MPLITAVHESLPYIDPEPTPDQRAAAEALIAAERLTVPDDPHHALLAPLRAPAFSPLIEAELARAAAKQPLKAIDLSRYEAQDLAEIESAADADATAAAAALATQSAEKEKEKAKDTKGKGKGRGRGSKRKQAADAEAEAESEQQEQQQQQALDTDPKAAAHNARLSAALRRAYASATYLRGRRAQLALLDSYGRNSWLVGNWQLEAELRALESELAEARREVEGLAVRRRAAQEAVAGELRGLDEAWRAGVAKVLETEVAAEELRRRVLERRREVAAGEDERNDVDVEIEGR